ncbi:MAG: ABC transporter permease [Deltaproteobacteria bacterium]|nr:ABC transporter permease [Deltaproteobacteria bacterium]
MKTDNEKALENVPMFEEETLWGKIRGYVIPVLSLSIFVLLWEAFARSGLVDMRLLPPPSQVFETLWELSGPGDGERPPYLMIQHTMYTLYRLIVGYLICVVLCTALGLLLGINQRVYEWVNPIVAFFMPIPSFTLVFVVILWLGLGSKTVIVTVVIGASFPIIYNAAAGVRSAQQKMIWAAQLMGCSRFQVFFKVLLPGAMGYIIAGQKLALGRAWRAVIGGEIFASTTFGLGFMIHDASTFLDTRGMFAAIITVGITGLIMENLLFRYVERHTVERWGMVTTKRL